MTIQPGQIYQHYKGKRYKIIGIAIHSETEEDMIVYQALYDNRLWVRPLALFQGDVTVDGMTQPRFHYVGSEN